MIKSITLLGSSSGRNAGDAALMSGIMDAVDDACQKRIKYEIPTICPSFVSQNYRNDVVPLSLMPWNLSFKVFGLPTYRSIMRTDLSLVFDAVLFDRSLYNPLFNFLSTLAFMLPRAKKHGKKMGFYNVGAGPVDTPAGRRMLRDLAEQMDFITVRDQGSLDVLKDIGVTNKRMLLTADAALNAPSASDEEVASIYNKIGLNPADEIMAVNVNKYIDTWARPKQTTIGKEKFIETYAAALNHAIREIKVPLLFVATQHHDVEITKELMDKVKSPAPKVLFSNREYNHHAVKGVLSKASLLVGMRLHAMILATSELCPTVGIAYQPKCEYYFDSLGLSERMLHFKNFSQETLAELIIEGWHHKAELKHQLEKRIPFLKNEAFKAAALVAGMHRNQDLDSLISEMNNNQFSRAQHA